MNAWFRRLLLILMIGGGFVGIALTAQAFSRADRVIAYIALLAFVALNGYGIFLGVRLSDGSVPLRHLRFYFALQIPFISSPIIAYRFATGLQVTIAMMQSGLRSDWRLGSEGQLAILSPALWRIGINVVAVAIVLLLYSRLAVVPEDAVVARPNQSLEPTAGRCDAHI
jgi:hypothetical protein